MSISDETGAKIALGVIGLCVGLYGYIIYLGYVADSTTVAINSNCASEVQVGGYCQ